MTTLEEIKKLLETELSPIRANLQSIEKKFSDLKTSVDYMSAKHDEVLNQLGRLNNKNFSLTTDVKNLKHDVRRVLMSSLIQYKIRIKVQIKGNFRTNAGNELHRLWLLNCGRNYLLNLNM